MRVTIDKLSCDAKYLGPVGVGFNKLLMDYTLQNPLGSYRRAATSIDRLAQEVGSNLRTKKNGPDPLFPRYRDTLTSPEGEGNERDPIFFQGSNSVRHPRRYYLPHSERTTMVCRWLNCL